MMKKSVVLFLLVILTACSAFSTTTPPAEISASQTPLPPILTPTFFTPTAIPSSTPIPTAAQTSTLPALDDLGSDEVATAITYLLDSYQITMTAAANQISTLQSQQATSVAAAASSSGSSSDSCSCSGSSSQGSQPYIFAGYSLPPDVNPATITDDAFLEITKSDNPNGVPIMEQYQPQIHLYPGTQTFVYSKMYTVDGGGHYYKVYDPDGHSTAEFYLRQQDIQIKLRNATPPAENYPSKIVKARATSNVVAYYIDGYDEYNKPIMEVLNPHITYGAGDTILIDGTRVIASGNYVFYAVYDPDGHSSIFIIGEKLEMLRVWD